MAIEREKAPLGDRMRGAFLKPVDPGTLAHEDPGERFTVDELADEVKYADDKERLIGLIAAPVAAAIGIIVMTALIDTDPAALLKGGVINKAHVSLSIYYDLTGVLLGLAVLILASALFRKRLFMGIASALYGLAIFNMHFWGFGVPFILVAAWYLVRSYRLQRDLKQAEAEVAASRTRRHR